MSANDFTVVAKYLAAPRKEMQPIPPVKPVRSDCADINVETHPMSRYPEILVGATP